MAAVASSSRSHLNEDFKSPPPYSESKCFVLKGFFFVTNGILSLVLVILGILLWNHCPSEPSLARCIVASGAFSLFLVLFSAALMTLDSDADSEFMEREERERVVAGNVVRLALAIAAFASYVSLLAYVIKLAAMDDRMVKCSDFLRDLGLAAAIVGMVQTLLAAVALIMRMLRCCTGEDGGTGIEGLFKSLFGSDKGIEDNGGELRGAKKPAASSQVGNKGRRGNPAAKYQLHIEPKRPAATPRSSLSKQMQQQPQPQPRQLQQQQQSQQQLRPEGQVPHRGVVVATVEPQPEQQPPSLQQQQQQQPPSQQQFPSGLENSLELSSGFI